MAILAQNLCPLDLTGWCISGNATTLATENSSWARIFPLWTGNFLHLWLRHDFQPPTTSLILGSSGPSKTQQCGKARLPLCASIRISTDMGSYRCVWKHRVLPKSFKITMSRWTCTKTKILRILQRILGYINPIFEQTRYQYLKAHASNAPKLTLWMSI